MIAASVVGFKKSGKTTLVEQLLREMERLGRRTAVVKCSETGFDEPADTDTARFKTLAPVVAGISDKESFVSWARRRPLYDLVPLLDADTLLVEGGKDLGYLPRIVLARPGDDVEALDRGLALAVLDPAEADPAGLARLILERGFLLPGLSCGACGRKGCAALAREIVAGQAGLDDCAARDESISVRINGRELAMKSFVADMVASGIRGMLSALKGVGPGPIDIHIG
ncbi:MAG: molybdopterin-guanine dinucleotide biosynthesis protein MobB [Desulfovibrionaceae bacterium]